MTPPTRTGVLGLAVALSATCLALLPTAAAQAVADPTPPAQASTWLKSQLQGNLLHTGVAAGSPVDVEASMDAAFGFQTLGDTSTAQAITTALAPSIAAYVGTETSVKATETARSVFFAQALGADPTTYGTVTPNLVSRLADGVSATAPYVGRVEDYSTVPVTPPTSPPTTTNVPSPTDATGVVGQAYAAAALTKAATATGADPTLNLAARANSAYLYLSGLQCAAGFFSDTMPTKANVPQTCDVTKPASVAATASVVIALSSVPAAKPTVDKAVAWLVAAQQSNGRWTPTGTAGSGDALTTGLAGYAVALGGRANPAAQAAVWLRGQQLANAGTCTPAYPASDLGAVALDGTTYDSAPTTPIAASDARAASFRQATARSLATLKVTPAGDAGTTTMLTVPKFAQPGKGVAVSVRSSARNTLCASASNLAATRLIVGYDGTASYTFYAPASGALTTTVVDAAGLSASATVTALPKKKLSFSFKAKKVRSGKVAVVKVKGLAPGENVKVKFRNKRKDTAVANSSGQAKLRFIVSGKRGYVPVRVAGEYSNRNRTKNLIVVR